MTDPATDAGQPAPSILNTPPATPPAGTPPPPFALDATVWGTVTPEFPQGFEDNLKNEASLKSFVGPDGKFNHANVMKSYIHAQKALGRDKVALPNDKSTPDEIREFNKKLGWVENEAEYKFSKVMDDKYPVQKEFVDNFRKFAHANNMPIKQAEKMLDFFEKETVEGKKTADAKATKEFNEGLNNLKSKWGNGFDRKISAANKFITDVGGDKLKAYVEKKGLDGDAEYVEILADLYEKIQGEDHTLGAEIRAGDKLTPEEAKREINEILGDKKGPYWDKTHPSHNDKVQRVLKLSQLSS